MWYLFIQIWLWLLGAFILGWAAHWFICCRNKDDQYSKDTIIAAPAAATNTNKTNAAPSPAPAPAINDNWKPQGFASRPDSVDDIKRIKGVGAVIEKTLNDLGIYQFSQIASWDSNNVAWVENFLAFPGRIERESWISQANTLASGGTTDFAQRVDKGDVDYDS